MCRGTAFFSSSPVVISDGLAVASYSSLGDSAKAHLAQVTFAQVDVGFGGVVLVAEFGQHSVNLAGWQRSGEAQKFFQPSGSKTCTQELAPRL